MRKRFTNSEVSAYRADGFVVIEDFLDRGELAQWRAIADAAVAANVVDQPAGSKPHVFTQRMNLRLAFAPVSQLITDSDLGRLVAELAGVDAVRVYLDQILVKEPFASPTQFHLDLPWWSFTSDHGCTIWVALDDSTTSNGCVYFVPGSHRLTFADDDKGDLGPELGAIFRSHPEIDRAPVPAQLPAGGCTVHNARTIHGAGANMTRGRRRAFTVAFMPNGVRYNGVRDERSLGTDYLDSLAIGDVLMNEAVNPVVPSNLR